MTKPRAFIFILVLSVVSACSNWAETPDVAGFSGAEASIVSLSIGKILRSDEELMFVCGQSDGLAIYADEIQKGYQTDRIKDGRMAFVKGGDRYDLIVRPTGGNYVRLSEEGAIIQRLMPSNAPDAESWSIYYPDTGMTETHNLAETPEGLIDLHTESKPASLGLPPRAFLFRAKCRRA